MLPMIAVIQLSPVGSFSLTALQPLISASIQIFIHGRLKATLGSLPLLRHLPILNDWLLAVDVRKLLSFNHLANANQTWSPFDLQNSTASCSLVIED